MLVGDASVCVAKIAVRQSPGSGPIRLARGCRPGASGWEDGKMANGKMAKVFAGSNLMSGWREENEAIWRRNYESVREYMMYE